MNQTLFEQLLHEDESTSLDFKRDQYPFQGAPDSVKAEIIKDVLAFANSWRRSSAFILLGVEENPGGRAHVRGVTHHLRDADLQQFVNSKTNRPVEFSYRAFIAGEQEVGIIEIPKQKRPAYLTHDFGGLRREVVYVRRGSSTAVAAPDEIAQMGQSEVVAEQPILALELADCADRLSLGNKVELESLVLNPRVDPVEFRPPRAIGPGGIVLPAFDFYRNSRFGEELVQFVADMALLRPIGFRLENRGDVVATGVEVVASIQLTPHLTILDPADKPVMPRRSLMGTPAHALRGIIDRQRPHVSVETHGATAELCVRFDRVAPKATVWSSDMFWIGSTSDQIVRTDALVYASNLSDPLRFTIELRIVAREEPMQREWLLEVAKRYES